MVIQYPDNIVITISSAATQNDGGDWVKGYTTSYTFNCRAEVNNSGRRVQITDGVLIDYSFMCYTPLNGSVEVLLTTEVDEVITTEAGESIVVADMVSDLQYGTEAKYSLTTLNGEVNSGVVKRAFNGQFNSRLWL